MNKLYLTVVCIILFFPAGAQWTLMWEVYEPLNSVFFTDTNHGYTAGNNLIFKTTDAGVNWSGYTLPDQVYITNIYFPTTDTGYAVGNIYPTLKLFKTINAGETWTLIYSFENYSGSTDVFFTNAYTGYLLAGHIILKTTNGGTTWTIVFTENYYRSFNSIFFYGDSTGYAAGNHEFIEPLVYKTVDAGVTWTDVTPPMQEYTSAGFRSVYFVNADTGFCAGGGMYETSRFGFIYKTTDGGISWTSAIFYEKLVNDLFFPSEQQGYAVGQDGYFWKTTDGGTTWMESLLDSTVYIPDLYSVHFTSIDTGYTINVNGHIYKTTTGGVYVGSPKLTLPAQSLLITPNPTRNTITLSTPGNGRLLVYTLSGEQVAEHKVTGPSTVLNISPLPTGVYLVKYISNSGVLGGKVVKM